MLGEHAENRTTKGSRERPGRSSNDFFNGLLTESQSFSEFRRCYGVGTVRRRKVGLAKPIRDC